MKVIAIICLLSVAFYSCGGTTSSTSYYPYSAAEYRTRQVLAGAVLIAGVVFVIWVIDGAGKNQSAAMESWKGHHISKLIRSCGPPQNIVSDGAGGRIYIWSSHVKIPLSKESTQRHGTATVIGDTVYYREKTTTTPATNIEYDKVRMFWGERSRYHLPLEMERTLTGVQRCRNTDRRNHQHL